MREKGIDLQNDHIVFLTGKEYYINLVGHIKHYSIVGEGLPIGKKLQEFDRIAQNNKKNDTLWTIKTKRCVRWLQTQVFS